MTVHRQIVDERIQQVARILGVDEDMGLLRMAHSVIVGHSIHAFDEADIVDGGQDKQIDVISIEDVGDSADVYILQIKRGDTFSSNALIQMRNGLSWLFERPRSYLSSLSNQPFKDKIYEYRSVQSNLGPSNIRVHVRFVTLGDSSKVSDEFTQELAGIRGQYDNDTFDSFDIAPIGASDLVALLRAEERRTRQINADIKIKYDANNPSLIRYYAGDLKGLVCTVPALEIARLVLDDRDGSIFDLNIRRFLGSRGTVNRDILATCTDASRSYEFWYLNNGITVVCNSFDAVTDPDQPHLKLSNMQIVNGCQTATSLALAHQRGDLAPDTRVLLRVYETSDTDLVQRIVLTTNNQNQISNRDLRANDGSQIDMEEAFRLHDLHYERKPRQYDGSDVDPSTIFANEGVAQLYLAVVLRNAADARGRKYKVWGEHYSKIFSGAPVEPYIIASLIGRRVAHWLKESGLNKDADDVKRMIAKRGFYHLARISASKWIGGDSWPKNPTVAAASLEEIKRGPGRLDAVIPTAFALLEKIIREDSQYSLDIDRALKSYRLDEDINRVIHVNSNPTP